MKKMIRLITLGATVALLALPIAAKSIAVEIQDQCTEENKALYYKTFLENRKEDQDQAKAYENAKKHLACPPPADITPEGQKIIDYLKRFVAAYEAATKKAQLPDLLYTKRDYIAAYTLGRELTAAEPDNLKYLIDLGANGYLLPTTKNTSFNADAVNYARKAIQMLEAGKTVTDWKPLTGPNDSLAYLNYTIGTLTLEQDPSAALKNLMKAAQLESSLKKEPYTYAYLGGAYSAGPYAKLEDQYKPFQGKDETPESKLLIANINQMVDRIIDAYARAVSLAGSDTKYTAIKKEWTDSLTALWKYRNNIPKDQPPAGMTEFVAGVLAKPLPPEPTPLTSLPTPPATPAATPTATSGNGTPTATSTTAPAAKPTPKPTPGGPNKPRN
jgi:hypothetical protein